MKFLIDENIRKEVKDFLKNEGYDILNIPSGTSDEEIARIAQENKRIILTHDHHFADILMYPPEKYAGIIRIKIHPPDAAAVINSLRFLLIKSPSEEFDRHLIILEKDDFRIR